MNIGVDAKIVMPLEDTILLDMSLVADGLVRMIVADKAIFDMDLGDLEEAVIMLRAANSRNRRRIPVSIEP